MHVNQTCPFLGTSSTRSIILQLNIASLTASKVYVLHHLEIHFCGKLIHPSFALAGFSFSRKHGLATFVHERLKYTLLKQSPLKSETEWLCVDVDGLKIVKICKHLPTRLQASDLPEFPRPCSYADDFNCPHADWGYGAKSAN